MNKAAEDTQDTMLDKINKLTQQLENEQLAASIQSPPPTGTDPVTTGTKDQATEETEGTEALAIQDEVKKDEAIQDEVKDEAIQDKAREDQAIEDPLYSTDGPKFSRIY